MIDHALALCYLGLAMGVLLLAVEGGIEARRAWRLWRTRRMVRREWAAWEQERKQEAR